MSERQSEVDEAIVRDVLDTVTAACDYAQDDPTQRGNDGKLWIPLSADSLLTSKQTIIAPDLSDIFPMAPKAGDIVEVVSRYGYGRAEKSINIQIRPFPHDPNESYTVDARFSPYAAPGGGPVLFERASSSGFMHGERDEPPTEYNIPLLLERLYPGIKPGGKLALTDVFREAVWRQIEAGAEGHTREEYEKAVARKGPRKHLDDGFHLRVAQENRTYLQGMNRIMRIILRQAFEAEEYGGVYDGTLNRSVSIEQTPDDTIATVSQSSSVRLQNHPYVDGGEVGAYSVSPLEDNEIPKALKPFTAISDMPDTATLLRFKRLATQPVAQGDLRVF